MNHDYIDASKMTVEEIRQKFGDENGNSDKFPVGMRVLAVDDDPTCLMLLDGLLRKCQYEVTTTSQATIALEMLRENRNRFDLVISDVHMPDMDGFKLLELVGLEMDLPVIMLSAYSGTKLVMKGITHGACDYLVKPVRIEELRNIWQHVLRRKKFDSKYQKKSAIHDKVQEGEEAGQGTDNADQNGNLNKKRKEEEEDGEQNGYENEDPATQKKPRVVWSMELHRKFVAAVNQLGIERAVPKRILDLMNVEGLTRENVASHLQKYRLYLKRISSVATQQANIVAALGCKDSSYMRIGSFSGVGEALAGSGRHSNPLESSYPPGGLLGRLNTPGGVSLHSLASSALIQPNHVPNSSNSINSLGKFRPVVSSANLFQGVQTSPKFDLQQSKCTSSTREATFIVGPTVFTAASTFAETSMAVCRPSNSVSGGLSNPLMLQGVPQQSQSVGRVTNHSSCDVTSFNPRPFSVSASGSTSVDHGRCSENWQNAKQLPKFSTNSLSLTTSYNYGELPPSSLKEDSSSTIPGIQGCPLDFSSVCTISAPLEDSVRDNEWQSHLGGDILNTMNEPSQQWRDHKHGYNYNSNHMFSAVSSLVRANCDVGPLSQSFDQLDECCVPKMNVTLVGQSDAGASILTQHCEVERLTVESKMSSTADYPLEQTKSQGGFVPNHNGSLDDLMNAMIKQEQDRTMTVDDELGFDTYSFGSCL